MIRDREDGRRNVLRLWASGALLIPSADPVWLGQVRIEAVDDVLGLFNRWRDTGQAEDAMRALDRSLDEVDPQVVGEEGLRLIREPGPGRIDQSSSSSAS